MPVIRTSTLPSFDRISQEGYEFLTRERANSQEIRALHVGFLNMMPDAAMEATERQWLRLISGSSQIVQIHMHFFTLPGLPRGPEAQAHIDRYYEPIEKIMEEGLDAMIVTGTNDLIPDLYDQPFWANMSDVIEWSYRNTASTLCSCLASSVLMWHLHGEKHSFLPQKQWGVYKHYKVDPHHPLLIPANTRFFVPHSRNFYFTPQQFKDAGLHVIVESEEAGPHIAVSEDRFRYILMMGHPEYDTNSLLKEYKREVMLYIEGRRADYPPFVENYFSPQSEAILEEFKDIVLSGNVTREFPEDLLEERLSNVWSDSCRTIMNSWIGQVYQITDMDRKKPFMPHIDPNDPLGIKARKVA